LINVSRNFELLQHLKEEQEIFRPLVQRQAASCRNRNRSERFAEIDSAPVGADPEINRLVQRLFFGMPETPDTAAVSFAAVDISAALNDICARAAVLMAQSSASVCAVDADFSMPTLGKYFGIERRRGLADALVMPGPVESFGQRLSSALTVFPSGNIGSEAQGAELSSAMSSRFAELRAKFDYVLIQSPILSRLPQASFVARLSDGVVLILEANTTRRDSATKLKHELQQSKVVVLGAVLNNRTFPIPPKLYSKL
jgi:hypothetical protein